MRSMDCSYQIRWTEATRLFLIELGLRNRFRPQLRADSTKSSFSGQRLPNGYTCRRNEHGFFRIAARINETAGACKACKALRQRMRLLPTFMARGMRRLQSVAV